MHPVKPSSVCSRIIRTHRTIGSRLDELSRVVALLSTGGRATHDKAVALTHTLADALSDQLALEGRLLEPALRQSDAWGALRADALIDRHVVRQGELRALRESCGAEASPDLVRTLRRFILARRTDMNRAERYVLILRDDIVGIDVDGG